MKRKILIIAALSAMVVAPVLGVKYESDLHNDFVAVKNIKSSSQDLAKNLSSLNGNKGNSLVNTDNLKTSSLTKASKDLAVLGSSIKRYNSSQNATSSVKPNKIINQQFLSDIGTLHAYIGKLIYGFDHYQYNAGAMKLYADAVNAQHPEYNDAVNRITKEISDFQPKNIPTTVNGPGGIRYNMHVYYYFYDGSLNSDGTAHLSHGDTYIHASNAHVKIGANSSSKYGAGIYMDKDHPLQVKIAASYQHTVSFLSNENSLKMIQAGATTQYKNTALSIQSKGPASDPTVWGQMYQTNAKTNVQTSERVGAFPVYNWAKKQNAIVDSVCFVLIAFCGIAILTSVAAPLLMCIAALL